MKRLEGATSSQRLDGVLQIHLKGTTGILPRVVAVAEEGGFNITDLSVTEPTLQNVFINLTGTELRD
jgi:ABC-2 type transport system ATP-binding protein